MRRLVKAHNSPQGKVLRARILLLAFDHPEWSNQHIAQEAGCTDWTVPCPVRTVQGASGEGGGPTDEALRICPGRERPGVFPPEVRAQATALACGRPRQKGLLLVRWSAAEIVQFLIRLGIVARISVSTVGRWLAQEKIRSWCYHTWRHILDPKAFLERARPILRLYERAQALLREGVWVVCTDEKTSIQARRREQPTRPAGRGRRGQFTARYERQGALQLFAGLSVADGRVYGMCRHRKRFVDYQAFLLEVIIPEALRRGVQRLALILDNGTTHAPKQLERWLDKETQARGWPLTIQVCWLPTNASWLDQIEIWLSILQRKLLNPNDFESLKALEKAIRSFIRYCNRTAKPIHWTYTVEKLEQKLGAH